MSALMLYLRVNGMKREYWIDLPELTSIQLGWGGFSLWNVDYCELIMRSGDDGVKWWIDLPKLTSLTTTENSWTLCYPCFVILESSSILVHSLVDLPELKEVVLPEGFLFSKRVVTQGSIFISHVLMLVVGIFQSNQSQKDIATPHMVFDCCSTYSLLCYHTHSCTSHHSHFFHFLSILVISTHTICHTFSQSSLHSSLFFPILPTAFTHHS